MDFPDFNQSRQGTCGSSDVIIVEWDSETVVFLPAGGQGSFQLAHQLAVPRFKDVQSGPFSRQEEDSQGEQWQSE
jgi:hypothetical protein